MYNRLVGRNLDMGETLGKISLFCHSFIAELILFLRLSDCEIEHHKLMNLPDKSLSTHVNKVLNGLNRFPDNATSMYSGIYAEFVRF